MANTKLYFSITEKHNLEYGDKTIVLMLVGSFFEVYGLKTDDGRIEGSLIEEYGQLCDLKVTPKKLYVNDKMVVMAGFRDYMLEKYLNKLQHHGYTAVIYTQDADTSNTTRSLSHVVSPGTSFHQDEIKNSNNICCFWLYKSDTLILGRRLVVGVANIDIFTGDITLSEYNNIYYHNPTTYDDLERFISIYKPVESIIIHNMEEEVVEEIIQYVNLNSKKNHIIHLNTDSNNVALAEKCENQVYQKETIHTFFPNANEDIMLKEWSEYTIAAQALCYLLDFVKKHNPSMVLNLNNPRIENNTDRLILANHSLKQLNMIDDQIHNGKYSSVNKLLNMCVTPMGKRMFDHILLNPIKTVQRLNESYEITEHVLNRDNLEEWKPYLANIKDMDKLKRKAILGRITPADFYHIYEGLTHAEELHKIVSDDSALKKYINKPQLIQTIHKLKGLLEDFFDLSTCGDVNTLSFEKCMDENDQLIYFVNRGVDTTLDGILKMSMDCRDKLESIRKQLEVYLSKREKGKKAADGYIKYHETGNSGIHLQLTARRAALLKSELDQLPECNMASLKYTSKFSNQEETFDCDLKNCSFHVHTDKSRLIKSGTLNQIYSQIIRSKTEYITTLKSIYRHFVDAFVGLQDDFTEVSQFITDIDVLYSKYQIAKTLHYSRPTIEQKEKSFMDIKDIRHSLIEKIQQNEIYITNDIELGATKYGICLFGTNAVGKTCLIKAMGICVILAQCGLYVPCSKMVYFPYDYLFTRILGNDNIFKGLSTFEVEMSELRVILKHATPNSMILGDELCSGTEIDSALGLFASGLEMLHQKECSFIFATHFHKIVHCKSIQELTKLKMNHMTVRYNAEQNKLIYDRKLKDGSGDSIYGLEVCKSLDLPQEFLDRAYEIRRNHIGEQGILEMSTSRYNKNKLRGVCEICRSEMGTEIHHLQYQQDAKHGFIEIFNVNHVANLISACEGCHRRIHTNNLRMIKQKTSNGYEFVKI